MAIFTAIATAALAGTIFAGSALATSLLAGALALGASYAVQAIIGNKNSDTAKTDHFSAQGTLQAGGDVPRSFQLGYSVTAGSLVYSNEWGQDGETPNAYHTQVISVQDLPGGNLVELWVNGALVSVDWNAAPTPQGYPVLQYRKDGKDHLWIKFYDGTQTIADQFLVGTVSSADRPYQATRVGYGVAYFIATALVEDTLFTGFPTYKVALSGIPLYDISRDSSVGGDGPHRWSDRSTWGGDGDNLTAVQAYNIFRGITYNGQWFYGLQKMTAARLPASNWIAQVTKCRAAIDGEDGPEPTYRSGGQINVSTQPINAIKALMLACQGRIADIGGFYKCHLGAPDSPSFVFTDDDLLVTDEQSFKPFSTLADSVNGIVATYPLPSEGWATKAAPALLRPDLEARDGGRRLLANPSFDMVPYSAQVQRLMSSALEEAQRQRKHVLPFPPAFWFVEPNDIGAWTSARNGYDGKLFRVDGAVDRANCDVSLALSETDPSDFDWDHDSDFETVTTGPTVIERPAAQGVLDWFVEAVSIDDEDGIARRPALRVVWDGTLPGISGIEYEVRLTLDQSPVTSGASPPGTFATGAIVVGQSILPATSYQARGRYIPSSPRDVNWSAWLTVTTLDVRLSDRDFDEAIRFQVNSAFKPIIDRIADAEDTLDILGNEVASSHNSVTSLRGQTWKMKEVLKTDITEVRTIVVTTAEAFAQYQLTVTARFDATTASISQEITARSTADTALAYQITTIDASVGAANARITQEAYARSTANDAFSATVVSITSTVNGNTAAITQESVTRANADSAISSVVTTLTSTVNGNTTAITQESVTRANADSAIAGTVTTLTSTVNGNTAAISAEAVTRSNADGSLAAQINTVTSTVGSHTTSITTVQSSVNGISAQYGVLISADGSVPSGYVLNGIRKLDGTFVTTFNMRGDILVDGTVYSRSFVANTIDAQHIAVGGVDINNLVKGAATTRQVVSYNGGPGGIGAVFGSQTINVKDSTITCVVSGSFTTTSGGAVRLLIDGNAVKDFAIGTSAAGTFSWDVTGLSLGNHTVGWQVYATGGIGSGASYDVGQASVQGLWR